MSSLRILRRRIRSVQSTEQITKAMEMVSAAKLRRSQRAAESARPYASTMATILGHLARAASAREHPLFERRPAGVSLLVVISADRGLCGAFNTNLVRRAAQLLRERAAEDVRLLFIGKKAWEYFRRRSWPIAGLHRDLGGQLDLVRAQTITDELLDRFLSGEVREVNLLYTRFLSTLVRRVTLDPFLPIEPEAAGGETGFARSAAGAGAATGAGAPTGAGAATGAGAPTGAGAATGAGAPRPAEAAAVSRRRAQEVEYIFEPSPEGIFETLLPRYALTRVMAALLESFAAEHAARMVAMGSASRNAEEMIDNLILLRNRIRQAGITKEIAELVGGAEALR